ncbi:LOW QUALITY PROTEIN: eukaryotic translation initiation factor 4E-binding protein 3 [Vombatus ursinus]|uniref:LOW QUALITY PROTEIN: eukaryotic translation initiation factor 4E-binding protein 3 n=1 Tax=Vombatus ursinus TaxID=29139 RepID=UPI000FFD27BC|nr:LOW QUALITY PROTEIN: eukaryotic translation initiation factor 4E-binding protein 3 [Vombatus ursinus]
MSNLLAPPRVGPALLLLPGAARGWDPTHAGIRTQCPSRHQLALSTSTSCPIPGGRDRLPDCYSTTPGGTLYATTSGGTRIIYDRKFLLECKNSPIALTPPCYFPQIPGVTVSPQAPLAKIKELKEKKKLKRSQVRRLDKEC